MGKRLTAAFTAALSAVCLSAAGPDGPDLVVVMGSHGTCKGCTATAEFNPDDRIIECPGVATVGATLVVSQSQSTGNASCRQWATEPMNCFLAPSDGSYCTWQANVEVLYSQNSCLGTTPIYIEGPGIAGRNPLTNSWSSVTLTSTALCSLTQDSTGFGDTVSIYHSSTGGTPVAQVTLKVKCSQCKKQ